MMAEEAKEYSFRSGTTISIPVHSPSEKPEELLAQIGQYVTSDPELLRSCYTHWT